MKKIMRLLKIIVFILLLVLISLPYAIELGSVYYLEKNYKVSASIDNVRTNYFTGVFGIEGVHIYGEQGRELHLAQLLVDLDLGLLFAKKINIESIIFSGLKTQVIEKPDAWNIGGLLIPISAEKSEQIEPAQAEEPSDWQFGLQNIEVENINIAVDTKQFRSQINLKKFETDQLRTWEPDKKTLFKIMLLVNEAPIDIQGEVRPLQPSLDLNTTVDIKNLQISPLISAMESELPVSDADASISSHLTISFSQQEKLKNIGINGELFVDNLQFVDNNNHISLIEERIHWNGELNMQLNEDKVEPDIKSSASLHLFSLAIRNPETQALLVGFDSFDVNQVQVNGLKNINVADVVLKQLVALVEDGKKKDALLKLNDLTANNIQYRGNSIDIADISLLKLNTKAVVDANGELVALKILPQSKKQESPKTSAEDNIEMTKNEKAANSNNLEMAFRLKNFSIKDSDVLFIDNSVTPVFETNINKIKLQVENIDTGNNNSKMSVNFDAGINEYGHVNVKGDLQPFSELLSADLFVEINNLALVPFSSYSGKYADLFIKRGTADTKIAINIVDDKLDIKNKIMLNKLKLEPGESEVSKSWMADMPMPLDLTLNVLRDKNDVIALDIPIEGKVSDPDFHLKDIYNTAMKKAMKVAATYYLAQAVQPLGLIMIAGKMAGDAAKPGFEPLVFDYGVSKLSSKNKKLLKKVAKLLADRPNLSLTICATSVEKDWPKIVENLTPEEKKLILVDSDDSKTEGSKKDDSKKQTFKKQKLLKLAKKRSQIAKRFIIDTAGIKPSRLQECNSKIAKEADAKPTVGLSL